MQKAIEDWTVEDVVEWLKFNGLDQGDPDICNKFSCACRQLILLYDDYICL
jgi:hypothetical protein